MMALFKTSILPTMVATMILIDYLAVGTTEVGMLETCCEMLTRRRLSTKSR